MPRGLAPVDVLGAAAGAGRARPGRSSAGRAPNLVTPSLSWLSITYGGSDAPRPACTARSWARSLTTATLSRSTSSRSGPVTSCIHPLPYGRADPQGPVDAQRLAGPGCPSAGTRPGWCARPGSRRTARPAAAALAGRRSRSMIRSHSSRFCSRACLDPAERQRGGPLRVLHRHGGDVAAGQVLRGRDGDVVDVAQARSARPARAASGRRRRCAPSRPGPGRPAPGRWGRCRARRRPAPGSARAGSPITVSMDRSGRRRAGRSGRRRGRTHVGEHVSAALLAERAPRHQALRAAAEGRGRSSGWPRRLRAPAPRRPPRPRCARIARSTERRCPRPRRPARGCRRAPPAATAAVRPGSTLRQPPTGGRGQQVLARRPTAASPPSTPPATSSRPRQGRRRGWPVAPSSGGDPAAAVDDEGDGQSQRHGDRQRAPPARRRPAGRRGRAARPARPRGSPPRPRSMAVAPSGLAHRSRAPSPRPGATGRNRRSARPDRDGGQVGGERQRSRCRVAGSPHRAAPGARASSAAAAWRASWVPRASR